MEELKEKYHAKIKIFNETLWDGKVNKTKVLSWLENFKSEEQIHALFLLTQFIYFSDYQIKEMFVSIYRDYFKYKHIELIRQNNSNTLDSVFIKSEFEKILSKTRFVALGNVSESSAHLMYIFRKENSIRTDIFIDSSQIIDCDSNVEHFVFIDDICGSGNQAYEYTEVALRNIDKYFPTAKKYYYVLVGTLEGKEYLKKYTNIDYIDSVLDLDDTFKCFDPKSRVFKNKDKEIDVATIKDFVGQYGKDLIGSMIKRSDSSISSHDLDYNSEINKYGYGNGQLLIAFEHNTPDNTLPVFWYNEDMISWNPIFKRANKIF